MAGQSLGISEAWGCERFFHDNDDGTFSIETRTDAKANIEHVKRLRESDEISASKEMVPVAHIPIGVMFEWLNKFGVDYWNIDHRPAVIRLLNDPDYRYLRIRNFII